MITKLTTAQQALLPQVRDEWLAVGLSTDPADRPAAEAGVRAAYARAGLTAPEVCVWLGSPLAGCVGAAMLVQVRGQVRGQVLDQVRDQVPDQVRDQVWDQVWDQVRGQVRDQVRDQVRGQVLDQVRGQVRDQVWDQVRGQVRDQAYRSLWGQHDAAWLSWADAMTRIGVVTADASGLAQVARNAGWWWAFNNVAILTERPTTLHRDGQGRLHHARDAALTYPDGWDIWAWHGVRVPRDLIETGWDTARILAEPNAEIRRCAIERTGWDRFLADSELTPVATAPDPGNAPHDLALYDLPPALKDMYARPARLLVCTNGSVERDGTRRRFGLVVPAHHADPVAAAADLYGLTAAQYQQMQVRK